MLGGTAIPEHDVVPPTLAYYGHPPTYDYDPAKAKGFTERRWLPALQGDVWHLHLGIRADAAIADERAGQGPARGSRFRSQPADDGLERTARCLPQRGRQEPEYDGLNFSRGLLDPVNAIIKLVGRAYWAPAGSNWGHYENAQSEALINDFFNEFDEEKRLALLTQLHEFEGRDAVMIFVVHDLNPRALSPKVQGFLQAQSWFQDLTPVSVAP